MDYCYHRFEKKNNEISNKYNKNESNKNESNSENSENSEITNELHLQYGENYKGYDYNIYLKRGNINCRFKENTKIISSEWSKYKKDKNEIINEEKLNSEDYNEENIEEQLIITYKNGIYNNDKAVYTSSHLNNHLFVDHEKKYIRCYLEI